MSETARDEAADEPAPSNGRWWRDAVFYQIYPRSFADSDDDGIGDLEGIRQRIPYLAALGVDALWLSPIFTSPMADFGYDVADYCDIDPTFGDLGDLDRLTEECHRHGLRLTLDWVPNHTSDRHPWFIESRADRRSAKRNWYVWRDPGADGGPPNNWKHSWSTDPAWTFDPQTGQYYLHLFLPEQPDLNWHEPALEAAMHDTLRFWLDRGIDGFRADVVHLIGKDPSLPDLPPGHPTGFPLLEIDDAATHTLLRRIRGVLDSYAHDPMMIGEVYLLGPGQAARYLGDDDELHLTFDFRSSWTAWDAAAFRRTIEAIQGETPDGGWPTWVLSNHDLPRHRTRFGSDARARAAAVMSLTQRGTPYLYAGEELGLPDAVIPDAAKVDPGGRDGCRAPIPWTTSGGHGWGRPTWLPFVDDAAALSVEAQDGDPTSMLTHYRHLLALRRAEPALRRGRQDLIDRGDGLLAWSRRRGDDHLEVVVNFTDEPRPLPPQTSVVYRSGDLDEAIGADEAVILRHR
jgi:alpha-glucosidase